MLQRAQLPGGDGSEREKKPKFDRLQYKLLWRLDNFKTELTLPCFEFILFRY